MALMCRKLQKHGTEMARMRGREHRELIPLVEVALAIMRLSCEKFFVLISVLASYLMFRDDVPRGARMLIRLNHRLSTLFQRVRAPCGLHPEPSGAGLETHLCWCHAGRRSSTLPSQADTRLLVDLLLS